MEVGGGGQDLTQLRPVCELPGGGGSISRRKRSRWSRKPRMVRPEEGSQGWYASGGEWVPDWGEEELWLSVCSTPLFIG